MSAKTNKAIVRRFQEELWKGNFDVLDEYVPEGVWLTREGREALKAGKRAAIESMPDLVFCIDEMIAEGDAVVFRWTITGTHVNPITTPFGVARPTGKKIVRTGFSMHHLKDGKIIDDLFGSNALDYYAQLGVVPV